MATDILSIPQIDPSKIEALQNDLHIGFGVAVKSEAIGRHTYATVSGWTWARLIEDGKALLAIADEVDATREYELVADDVRAEDSDGN